MTSPLESTINLNAPASLVRGDSALAALREQVDERQLYLVGGSVRDALLGKESLDLDVAVDGPVAALATELDPDALLHERFDTASISIGGRRMDLARTRSEMCRRPGSLPEVEPARIEADLARRDFTINAIAVALEDPETLIDPSGGLEDLGRRVIRVIHDRSFRDDPTRALRAARYAARLGFDIDHRTADLLLEVDLTTLSPQRLRSELDLISEEPTAVEALRLVSAWGLIDVSDEILKLAAAAFELLRTDAWSGFCTRAQVVETVLGEESAGRFRDLIEFPGSPSGAVRSAGDRNPVDLLLARAGDAEWLDHWITDWRDVRLEITGDDLVEAGIPRGEAVGIGLEAALEAALDRGVTGRDDQLSVALEAAGSADARGAGD